MNLVCPIDNKDDSIQKVSAVVASGQSTGTFSGPTGGTVSYDGKSSNVSGYTTLRGSSTSSLAKLLISPPEPIKPSGFGCLWILLWYPVIPLMGGVIGGLIAAIPLLVVRAFLVPLQNYISGDVLGTISLIIVVPSGFVGMWLGYRYFKACENEKKAKEELRYSSEKPQWEKAIEKWNRIYYCHKHDIVFDPENGKSCSPTLLKEFLYES